MDEVSRHPLESVYVTFGQTVLYYYSPSAIPLPAVVLTPNKDLIQSAWFKLPLLVWPRDPQKHSNHTPVKLYIVQAFHKDHPVRATTNDTSFWETYDRDVYTILGRIEQNFRNLESRVLNLEKDGVKKVNK